MVEDQEKLLRQLDSLRVDYQEMSSSSSEPLRYPAPPTALEALKMINRSRPALIEGCTILSTKGKEKEWSRPETYSEILDGEVSIAVTEDGLADSVQSVDGSKVFLKPLNEEMGITTFLTKLAEEGSKEIVYLQSQDGNVHRYPSRPEGEPQLSKLQEYIQPEVGWMQEALGHRAEAVNLWIGSSRSITSFHHDPFENIYHVLSGTKTFSLVSPIEGLWFDQQFYPQYTIHRTPSGELKPVPDSFPTYPVPWVEALHPPSEAVAIEVEVQAGQTLYLPSGWWHRVSQSPGEGGLAVAVNYWYPSDPDPQVQAYERLARRIAVRAGMKGVIPIPEDDESEDQDEDGAGAEGVDGQEEDKAEYDYIWASEDESGEEWDPKEWGR